MRMNSVKFYNYVLWTVAQLPTRPYYRHLQGPKHIGIVDREDGCSFPVRNIIIICQWTQNIIPENWDLHQYRSEKLKNRTGHFLHIPSSPVPLPSPC
jgi:hypothetical protein